MLTDTTDSTYVLDVQFHDSKTQHTHTLPRSRVVTACSHLVTTPLNHPSVPIRGFYLICILYVLSRGQLKCDVIDKIHGLLSDSID